MLSHISKKFKQNPSLYYSFSIAATWAGAGSFIVGTRIAQESGLFPWLLWALGNTLCCIVFGLLSNSFPKLREVAASRPIQILMGLIPSSVRSCGSLYDLFSRGKPPEGGSRIPGCGILSVLFHLWYHGELRKKAGGSH